MKKFFTLIAAVAMAASVSAQVFSFDTEYAQKSVPASITSNGLVLTLTDPEGKTAVDKNSQYFGTADSYIQFTKRLKTGGKSTTSKNYLTLALPSDGTLKVYARTGGSGERNIILTQGETQLINKILSDAESVKVDMGTDGTPDEKTVFTPISVSAKKGDVTISYPSNAIYIYGFELVSGTTGITSINAASTAKADVLYNLAGQQVSKSYKGIVVKNGKKFLNK